MRTPSSLVAQEGPPIDDPVFVVLTREISVRRIFAALLACYTICALAPAAAATIDRLKVIYSNFNDDPKERYDQSYGWSVQGKGAGVLSILAMPFTPAQDSTIRRIKVALEFQRGDNSLMVGVRADANGLPGDLLGQVEMTDLPPDTYDCCEVGSVTLVDGIPVSAGKQYWLVAHAKGDSDFRWNWSKPHDKGLFAYKNGSKWKLHDYKKNPFWNTFGAFSIMGDQAE
jgi:hypothetical protein